MANAAPARSMCRSVPCTEACKPMRMPKRATAITLADVVLVFIELRAPVDAAGSRAAPQGGHWSLQKAAAAPDAAAQMRTATMLPTQNVEHRPPAPQHAIRQHVPGVRG